MTALKDNQEELLQTITEQNGLQNAHELQKEILENPQEIKTWKILLRNKISKEQKCCPKEPLLFFLQNVVVISNVP